jgi:hypothetical protein
MFARLSILAMYLQCPAFENCLLDNSPGEKGPIVSSYTLPNDLVLALVYNNTVGKCGIRSYFAAMYVWLLDEDDDLMGNEQRFEDFFARLPADFVRDVATGALRRAQKRVEDPFREEGPGMKAFHVT